METNDIFEILKQLINIVMKLEKKIEILELQYHKDDKTVEDHNQILDNYNFIQKWDFIASS